MKTICALFALFVALSVTVRAQQPNPQPPDSGEEWVCVLGGVLKPSKITFRSGLTLTHVLSEVGGVLPGDKSHKVNVYRINKDRNEIISVDLNSIKKEPRRDLNLQAYDIVEVLGKRGGKNSPATLNPCHLSSRFLSL